MRAGQLKWRVTILQRSTTKDALGQPHESWAVLQTIWGDVRYQNGLNTLGAEESGSVVKASIRVRQSTGSLIIKAGMRARVGTAEFNITACLPQGRDAIDLVCEQA